jgi:putative copper export protein
VFTVENLLHFLHQLAAIVWVGGVLAVNVLQVRLGKGRDRAAVAPLLRLAEVYGQAVIAPAAAVVLVTGLILVPEMHLDFSDLWVVWGLAAIFLSLLLGATMIRGTNAELRRLAAASMQESPRWGTLQRRAAALYGINLVLLLSVVWAMVFQPTL